MCWSSVIMWSLKCEASHHFLSDQRLWAGEELHLVCRNTHWGVFEVKTFKHRRQWCCWYFTSSLRPTETLTWKFNVVAFVQPPPPPPPCRLLISGSFPCLSLGFSALPWPPNCWNKTFYQTLECRLADVLHPNLEIRGNGRLRGSVSCPGSSQRDLRWWVNFFVGIF